MKMRMLGLMTSAALMMGASVAQAKELTFATFLPAVSTSVSKVYEPWIEWFNAQTADVDVSIRLFPGGALGRDPKAQAQMVADGIADITVTAPSYTPGQYPDFDVFELPGFGATTEEGSEAISQLHREGKLKGYDEFYVVCLYTSGGYILHSSKPIASFEDIAGQKVRVAGKIQTDVIKAMGGAAYDLSALEMAESIDRGLIDAAMSDAPVAKTFRVADVARNHYDGQFGFVVFAILMNKDVYDGLPEKARTALDQSGDFIRKLHYEQYGGTVTALTKGWDEAEDHTYVKASPEDMDKIAAAVQPVVDEVAKEVSPGLIEAYREKLTEMRGE